MEERVPFHEVTFRETVIYVTVTLTFPKTTDEKLTLCRHASGFEFVDLHSCIICPVLYLVHSSLQPPGLDDLNPGMLPPDPGYSNQGSMQSDMNRQPGTFCEISNA